MQNASAHDGMGAIVYDGGVAFRVWAPNADAVFVTGSFNDWSEDAAAMGPEDGRYLASSTCPPRNPATSTAS